MAASERGKEARRRLLSEPSSADSGSEAAVEASSAQGHGPVSSSSSMRMSESGHPGEWYGERMRVGYKEKGRLAAS